MDHTNVHESESERVIANLKQTTETDRDRNNEKHEDIKTLQSNRKIQPVRESIHSLND